MLIWMKNNLPCFPLWFIPVVSYLGNLCLTQGCKNFSSKFSSRNLRFLHFTVMSITYFMLIFVCGTKYKLRWVFVLFCFVFCLWMFIKRMGLCDFSVQKRMGLFDFPSWSQHLPACLPVKDETLSCISACPQSFLWAPSGSPRMDKALPVGTNFLVLTVPGVLWSDFNLYPTFINWWKFGWFLPCFLACAVSVLILCQSVTSQSCFSSWGNPSLLGFQVSGLIWEFSSLMC